MSLTWNLSLQTSEASVRRRIIRCVETVVDTLNFSSFEATEFTGGSSDLVRPTSRERVSTGRLTIDDGLAV
jgi:hypothetical protein